MYRDKHKMNDNDYWLTYLSSKEIWTVWSMPQLKPYERGKYSDGAHRLHHGLSTGLIKKTSGHHECCGATMKAKSWGCKAAWTISCTALFRLQTSDISANLSVNEPRLDPDDASDIIVKNLERSESVRACGGIRAMQSLVQFNIFPPKALLRDSRTYETCKVSYRRDIKFILQSLLSREHNIVFRAYLCLKLTDRIVYKQQHSCYQSTYLLQATRR